MFSILVKLCLGVLFVVFFMSQIIIPLLRQTQTLPMFHKEKKLRDDMKELNQKIVEKNLEKEIKNKQKKEGVRP